MEETGDQAVAYVELAAGTDAGPLLEGLPDDKCSCPHWGYMLKGSIHLRYSDGAEETCQAGDLFYWPAGHTVWTDEDAAFIEFSPTQSMNTVYAHIREKASRM